jgi:subtilisin family serine protease
MRLHRRVVSTLLVLSMLVVMATPAFAQEQRAGSEDGINTLLQRRIVPAPNAPTDAATWQRGRRSLSGATIPAALQHNPAIHGLEAMGDEVINVVVHLEMPALVELVNAAGAERMAYANQVAQVQTQVGANVEALGGKVLFKFTTLSSGIAAQIPANIAGRISRIPGVSHVSHVKDYTRDLTETVPFIGAKALQDLGVTGQGVKVAVIDSGIDFSHLAFGGPGTVAGWEAAYYGDSTDCDRNVAHDPDCAYAKDAAPTLFGPNAPRVKGGFDWLGEQWDGTDANANNVILTDTNPIDIEGHGTHVADIIGGLGYEAAANADGPYSAKGVGVAPGVELYGFKACASFSSACNGLALLASVDNAADLDRNPATVDPVDIINLSLGSNYGQPEDDLTHFANKATEMGIIVVASAGNSANKPFIVGSPSIGDGVISVAQTTVPSATRYPLFYESSAVSGTINAAVFQNWSAAPSNTLIQGPVVYGNADSTNLNGCAPYTDDMTGKVVLADRGVCNFTLKAKNASAAGAVLSLIGLVAPGDPFEGGDGGDRPIDIPSFMISQAASNLLKAQIANNVVAGVNPAQAINLAYTMVGSSSRGPRNHDNKIKPDIGAPGASVSAVAGGGAESGPFGGTSGAAPMVSGVAALLKEAHGDDLSVQQYKALLMNTANLEIWEGDPGTVLAPITRIGGGQVDAAAAYSSTLIAWDSTAEAGAAAMSSLAWTGSLSFGYLPVADDQVYTRTLTVKNIGNAPQNVTLQSFFRYADDEGQGVTVTPGVANASIPAGESIQVPVVLRIFPAGNQATGQDALHPWVINKGSLGANGNALTFQEYDGYIEIAPATGDPVHVVWHVLPKAAADISLSMTGLMSGTGALVNASSAVTGTVEVFDLLVVDANDYNYVVGDCTSAGFQPGCNTSPIDLKEVGIYPTEVVSPNDLLLFAVTIWDNPFRASQYPPEFDIYIDADLDGDEDYIIFNADLARNGSDGRNAVFAYDLETDTITPAYFIDSTFNTQNFILPMDVELIGLAPGQPFRYSVRAFDAYFTGNLTDCAPKVGNACVWSDTYTPGQPRFTITGIKDRIAEAPPSGSADFAWALSQEGAQASPAHKGFLFMHRNALVGRESDHFLVSELYLPVIQTNDR